MAYLETAVVIDNVSGKSSELRLAELVNPTSTSITLEISPTEVANCIQAGNDLVLTLTSGQVITITGFFTDNHELRNELILKDEDGVLWLGKYEDEFTGFIWEEITSGSSSMGWWMAATGLGAAAIAADSHDSSSADSVSLPDTVTVPDAIPPAVPTASFDAAGEHISGNAEPGSTVTVYDRDGQPIASTQADPVTGEYVIELPTPLQNGEDVTVTATDKAGNESVPNTVTAPDITAPTAPSASFDADGDRITGNAEPGSTVTVYDKNGNAIGSAQADPKTGDYTVDLQAPLTDGEKVTVTATDPAGNESAGTAAIAPDTTAPVVTLDPLSSRDDTPLLTGRVDDPDAVIKVEVAGQTYTAINNKDGTWTLPDGAINALADGTHVVTVTATDGAGNNSSTSGNIAVLPDVLSSVDVPTLSVPQADDGQINTAELNDGIGVIVGLPAIAKAGDTITLTLTPTTGAVQTLPHVITPTEAANGSVNIVVPGPLADGDYSITAHISDNAGNSSADSAPVQFEVDTTAPSAPTAQLNQDTGALDGITADGTVNVGNLEAGATWEYSTNAGSTWAQGSGNSFELADGDYVTGDVLVRQTDEAGNTGPSTALPAVTVDSQSPGGAQATDKPGLIIADASDGELDASEMADGVEAQITLTPGTQPGDLITLTLAIGTGTPQTLTHAVTQAEIDSGNPLVINLPTSLAEGYYSATAQITDAAGNSSAPSDAVVFAVNYGIDRDGDGETLGIVSISADSGQGGDFVTNDNQLLIQGYIDSDDLSATRTFSVEVGGVTYTLGTSPELTVSAGTGRQNWTLDLTGKPALADDTYQVVARHDGVNGAFVSVSKQVVIDTVAPAAPSASLTRDTGSSNSDGITQDGTVTVTGLEPGATWQYSTDGGTTWIPSSGSSFVLPEGKYLAGQVQVQQTDVAGNPSLVGTLPSVTIDTTSPAGPAQDQVPVLSIPEAQDGWVNASDMTDGLQVHVTLTPNTAVGDTVELRLQLSGSTPPLVIEYVVQQSDIDNGRLAVIDVPGPLADGPYSATALIADSAGHSTQGSQPLAFTVDTTLPAAPGATLLNDTGALNDDGVTTDGTVRVGGIEPDATWGYRINGGPWVAGDSQTNEFVLPGGEYAAGDVLVRQTDTAGNNSLATSLPAITVDSTSPGGSTGTDAPVLVIAAAADGGLSPAEISDGVSADITLTSGTQVGDWLTLTLTQVGNTPVVLTHQVTDADLSGAAPYSVSIDLPAQFAEGDYQAVAHITDGAGNRSGNSNSVAFNVNLNVDADADGRSVTITAVSDDTGEMDDYITSDNLLVITGTVDNDDLLAGRELHVTVNGVTYRYGADAELTLAGAPDAGTGMDTWTLDLTQLPALANGSYEIKAKLVYPNVGESSASHTLVIDTGIPLAPTLSLNADTGTDGDGITNDGTVRVGGLEPGASWQYSSNGGANWTPATGNSFELDPGTYTLGDVLVKQTDVAGNDSPLAILPRVTVDITAPSAPSVTIADAADSWINRAELADGVDAVVALPADAQVGDLLRLTINGGAEPITLERTLSAQDLTAGQVSFTVNSLSAATYNASATLTDVAGNTSLAGVTAPFTVDNTLPDAPTLSLAVDPVAGTSFSTDGTVNVSNLETTGTWQYSVDGGANWLQGTDSSFVLQEGAYAQSDVQVRQTDAAGNLGPTGALDAVVIDTSSPGNADGNGKPTVSVAEAADGWVNAAENADGVQVQISLTEGTRVGDTIYVVVTPAVTGSPFQQVVTAAQFAAQKATVSIPGLTDGSYQISAYIEDAVGNQSLVSDQVPVNVDITAPDTPLLTPQTSITVGSVQVSDGVIDVAGLEVGNTWQYSLNAGGTWQTLSTATLTLAEGSYVAGSVLVRQQDPAGNYSGNGNLPAFTVDLTSPGGANSTDAVSLAIAEAADGWVNASEASNGIQASVGLTTGTRAGDTLTLTVQLTGQPAYEVTHQLTAAEVAAGTAQVTIPGPFTDGTYNVQAQISDALGNESQPGTVPAFVVDTQVPAAPQLSLAQDTGAADGVTANPLVNVGGIEPGATWSYSTDSGASWKPGFASNTIELPEGTYPAGHILVKQADAAGNVSNNGALGAITIDTTNPGGDNGTDAPVVSVPEAVNGTVNGQAMSDGMQVRIALTPDTQAGDNLILTVFNSDDASTYAVPVHSISSAEKAAGFVIITLPGNLADASYNLSAVITDRTGSSTQASPNVTVQVDKTAPDAPVLALVEDTVGPDGALNDGITSNGLITVTGLEDGASWSYSTNGGQSWSQEFVWNSGDVAQFTLPEGSYPEGSVLVRQTDEAGNPSLPGQLADAVIVDTTSPGSASMTEPELAIDKVVDGWANSADVAGAGLPVSVKLTADAKAGDFVQVVFTYNDGSQNEPTYPLLHRLSEQEVLTGTVQLYFGQGLQQGPYTAVATLIDPAGNASGASNDIAFVVDTQAPNALTAQWVSVTATDGSMQTSNGTVSVSGLEPDASWRYSTNGGVSWTNVAPGVTSFVAPEGSYAAETIRVQQFDQAGNPSALSGPGLMSVDTTSPGGTSGSDAPVLHIPEAGDGWLNAAELADGITVDVELTSGTRAGDTIVVTFDGPTKDFVYEYVVTAADVLAGDALFSIATEPGKIPDDGQYSVQVLITDPAGSSSAPSNTLTIGVDGSSPGGAGNTLAPTLVIVGAEDDIISESEVAGAVAQVGLPAGVAVGDIVSVVLTLDGQAPIRLTSQPLTATDLTSQSINIQLPNNMLTGDYSAYSYVADAAGNQSSNSNIVDFAVDRQVGAVLVTIEQLSPDTGVAGDWITNTGAITLQGTVTTADMALAESMTLTIGGVDYSDRLTFVADGSNITWTLNLSADALQAGTREVQASLTFNGSTASDSHSLVIDNTVAKPTLALARDTGTVDGVTADPEVRVSGLENGASWSYSLDNGLSWSTPVAWKSGQIASFDLQPGDYTADQVQVRQTDVAGNLSNVGSLPAVSLVTTTPATPGIVFTDDANGDGVLNAAEMAANTDGDTDVRIDLGSGASAGDRLAYSISNGPVSYYTLTEADVLTGHVALALPGLAQGAQMDLSVQLIDRAGNASASATDSLRVDTTGPEQASIVVQFADGDGYLNATEQSAASLTGMLDAGVTLVSLVITDRLGNQISVAPADITIGADHSFSYSADLSALVDGPLVVTMTVQDVDGNSSTRTDTSVLLTEVQANITGISTDTGTLGDWSTSDTTLSISGTTNVGSAGHLQVTVDGTTYVLGTAPELTLSGNNWTLNLQATPLLPGTYSVTVEAEDVAGNATGAVTQSIEIAAVVANDDLAGVDLGEASVVVHETQYASDVTVLGLAQATSGIDAGTTFTVQPDHKGSVAISIQQTALLAVADAFVVEVYDSAGKLVYSALTADSNLVADVGGLTVLGVVGDDTLVAVIHGLDAGEYQVVVRNDKSALAALLDTDGGGVSLTELGDAGMVLGPDNQAILLNAIETGLNGGIGNIPVPGIGTLVRGIVETALIGVDSLGVGQLVGILTNSPLLGATGVIGLADQVIDAIAEILLSNLLTVLQFTDIDITLSEYQFSGGFETSGNLIDGALNGVGEDAAPEGAVISQVIDGNGNAVPVAATGITTVTGQYGVLLISADGEYRYVANAHPDSIGASDQFTYTLSVPGGASDTAQLNVDIAGPNSLMSPADDQADLDLGDLQSQVQAPVMASDVQFLGLLEGSNSVVTGVPISVSPGHNGDVVMEVHQTALVSVADAIRIDVIDSQGRVVYSGVSANSKLVGNVAGLEIFGLTGDSGIVANVQGLEPGDYTVVIYQDQNLAASLLSDLDLTQLGEAGVVLGPDNQELVLDAVDTALGGNALSGAVRGLLEVTLGLVDGLGVGALVGTLTSVLNTLGLNSLLNTVLDVVAESLVANLLTVLQYSDVVATVTDYRFEGSLTTSGNVITGLAAGDVEDQLVEGSVVSEVVNAAGDKVVVLGSDASGVQIEGQYGVLTIYEDGRYEYLASGVRDGLGKQEVFTYSVTSGEFSTDGLRITDSATLTIAIDGVGVAADIGIANVQLVPRTGAAAMPAPVKDAWLLATRGSEYSTQFSVAADTVQDITVTLDRSSLLGLGEEMVITLQHKVENSWVAVEVIDTTAVISLLSLGGDAEFVLQDIEAGTYRFQVFASTLSVAGNYEVSFESKVTYLNDLVVAENTEPVTGNLLENDVIRQNQAGNDLPFTLLVEKQGVYTAVTAATTIDGEYGTLTLQSNGNYSYEAYADLSLNDFVDPLPERFSYQVNYGDRIETSELTVNVLASGYEGLALALDDGSIALLETGTAALAGRQVIDLRDAGTDSDRLSLTAEDVMELELDSNVLVIQGDVEDTLNLAAAPWVNDNTSSTLGGTQYHHYSLSNTTLWVQDGIQVVEGA